MRRLARGRSRALLFIVLFAAGASAWVAQKLYQEAEADWRTVERALSHPARQGSYAIKNEDGSPIAVIPVGEHYESIPLAAVDARFVADVVAVEDSLFYEHSGVRWNAVAGAAARYFGREALRLLDGAFGTSHAPLGNVRGGSTITQQLVKNLLKNPPRTVRTKLKEIFVARRLEAKLGETHPRPAVKRIVLERYLNEIYTAPGLRGIAAASLVILGRKDPSVLAPAERVALLACIQAPAALREGNERSVQLLARTYAKLASADRGVGEPPDSLRDTADRYRALLARLPLPTPTPAPLPPYVDILLHHQLPKQPGPDTAVRTCRHSGLDSALNQTFALATGKDCSTVGAFLLVRLPDGAVLSAGESRCGSGNLTYDARRQILSTFKPFLYARAMQELGLSPASVLVDRRHTVRDRVGRPYAPGNHYPTFKGPISLKTALQFSTNTISLQLLERMSVHSLINLGQELFRTQEDSRLRGRFHPDYALALGAAELSPAELATGYLTLLTGGRKRHLRFRCDTPPTPPGRQLIGPTQAAQVRDMLTAVVRWEGTAGFSPAAGPGLIIKELGGKSGSSERDSWFAGFSEDLLLVVWLGAGPGKTQLPSELRAASVWRSMFARTTTAYPPKRLEHPLTLKRAFFCRRTGKKPGPHCRIESSLFTKTQVPGATCPIHGSH